MNAIKILGIMAAAFGFIQEVHADGFDQSIERCRRSSHDLSVVRSCLESGRERITSALSSIGVSAFTADASLSALSSRTGVTWGTIASADDEIVHMNQYDAFEHCLNLNPASERERVAAALGYSRTNDRWENTGSLQGIGLDRDQVRAALREGDVYLPAIADFEGTPGELGFSWFWSSTTNPDDSNFTYYFRGREAAIDFYLREDDHAVRCVRR